MSKPIFSVEKVSKTLNRIKIEHKFESSSVVDENSDFSLSSVRSKTEQKPILTPFSNFFCRKDTNEPEDIIFCSSNKKLRKKRKVSPNSKFKEYDKSTSDKSFANIELKSGVHPSPVRSTTELNSLKEFRSTPLGVELNQSKIRKISDSTSVKGGVKINKESNFIFSAKEIRNIEKLQKKDSLRPKKQNLLTNKRKVKREVITVDMREYDVFHINELIKKKLNDRISLIPYLEKDLQKIIKRFQPIDSTSANSVQTQNFVGKNNALNSIQTHTELQPTLLSLIRSGTKLDSGLGPSLNPSIISQQLFTLRRQIQDAQSTLELGLYIFKTHIILEKIRKISSSNTSRSFVCSNNISMKEISEKESLISQFVAIARMYINIDNYARKADALSCPTCGSLDIRRSVEEDTLFICNNCTTEIEILDDTPTFKDTDRINMSNRYTYSRKAHFIDAMKKFQGKHNIDPEMLQTIVNILILEMTYHNLSGDNVTKNTIYMFLVEKKLNLYYDDINLLFHIITGFPCPDFSLHENLLLELFEEQEKALEEITALNKEDSRVNSINVYYKLYKLLQKIEFPITKSDFYILKTKTKEDEHDELMKKAWKKLGWEWIETF
jgi:hypothetical protein